MTSLLADSNAIIVIKAISAVCGRSFRSNPDGDLNRFLLLTPDDQKALPTV